MKKTNHKLISIVVATVAAGIPISSMSARQLDFMDPWFLITWSILGIFGSFVTFLYFNLQKRDIIGTFIIGYMLAVILRFVIDVIVNNIAHSNLSLSLIIAMTVGGFVGWTGSEMWIQLKKSRRKKK